MKNSFNKALIIIALSICVAVSIYFLLKNELDVTSDNIHSIYVGDIPNADEARRAIESNIEKFKKEAEIEKTRLPKQPITNLSEIEDSGMIQLDSKLFINAEAVLNPKEIQIDYTLKEVKLCGEIYKSKQIIMRDVDFIQRLSEILLEDQGVNDWFCSNLLSKSDITGGIIYPGEEIRISLFIDKNGTSYDYGISLGKGLALLDRGLPYSFDNGSGGYISTDTNMFAIGGLGFKFIK